MRDSWSNRAYCNQVPPEARRVSIEVLGISEMRIQMGNYNS